MGFDIGALPESIGQMGSIVLWDAIRYIPNVAGAIVLLLLGFFVSDIFGRIASGILDYLRVEKIFQKYKVEDALGGNEITPLLATAVRWYVMLLFLTASLEFLNLSSISWLVASVLAFAPVLLGVGLLIIAAAIVGEWVRETILEMHKFYLQSLLAESLKWAIVLISLVVSLETVGFQMGFIREVLGILFQGISYGLAIAFGLAFGLGGQKDAQDLIRKARKGLKI